MKNAQDETNDDNCISSADAEQKRKGEENIFFALPQKLWKGSSKRIQSIRNLPCFSSWFHFPSVPFADCT